MSLDIKNYGEMVANLFNQDPARIEASAAGLVHAALGAAGEVFELRMALETADFKNFKEEAGDLEFYLEAADTCVSELLFHFDHDVTIATEQSAVESRLKIQELGGMLESEQCQEPNQLLLDTMFSASMEMQDKAKRAWVYKNRTATNLILFLNSLNVCYWALRTLYQNCNVTKDEIQLGNMEKLIGENGRYKGMTFSCEAANARADKPAGE